jgi:hypothetical protein
MPIHEDHTYACPAIAQLGGADECMQRHGYHPLS